MADKKTSEENAAPLPLDGTELVRLSTVDSDGYESAQATTQDIADIAVAQAVLEAIATARIPVGQSITSAGTVTPTFEDDFVKVTAQAAALALANPTGTPIDLLGIAVRIKDNGTARAITYGSQYRAIGVTLPTTTVVSKTLYLGMIYNAIDTKWDVVVAAQEA